MSEPYVQPRMQVEDADTLFAPDRQEYSKRDAWADLHLRMDYKTGEVRASRRELAAAWGWTDSKVERWLSALADAKYVGFRQLGAKSRDGRAVVILSVSDRTIKRTKTGPITGPKTASDSNDLQSAPDHSPDKSRTNHRTTSKEVQEVEEQNLPPTGEGATGSRALVLVGKVADPTDQQKRNAADLLNEWIEVYRSRSPDGERPPEHVIRKQGAIAKRLASNNSRKDLVQAFHGMKGIWRYGTKGEPWDLMDLERELPKALQGFTHRQDAQDAAADAEFDRLTRGVA